MTSLRLEISAEADRIRESVELSAVQNFIAAKWWRKIHFVLGITATVGATISGALIFSKAEALWPGLLALAVAIIAGLITFLNPKDTANIHQRKGVDYQQLTANARILMNISCPYSDDEKDLVKQLKALSDNKSELDRQQPPTPGGIFYKLAKKSVARGETNFKTDSQ